MTPRESKGSGSFFKIYQSVLKAHSGKSGINLFTVS